jgi:hypothetical protein
VSDAAIATIVTGLVTITTIIAGVVTLWIKQRSTAETVEENTRLTKAGTEKATAAATEARDTAAAAASEAQATALTTQELLNGKLDDRIQSIVKKEVEELVRAFQAHAEQDEKNMQEIRTALAKLPH